VHEGRARHDAKLFIHSPSKLPSCLRIETVSRIESVSNTVYWSLFAHGGDFCTKGSEPCGTLRTTAGQGTTQTNTRDGPARDEMMHAYRVCMGPGGEDRLMILPKNTDTAPYPPGQSWTARCKAATSGRGPSRACTRKPMDHIRYTLRAMLAALHNSNRKNVPRGAPRGFALFNPHHPIYRDHWSRLYISINEPA